MCITCKVIAVPKCVLSVSATKATRFIDPLSNILKVSITLPCLLAINKKSVPLILSATIPLAGPFCKWSSWLLIGVNLPSFSNLYTSTLPKPPT